MPGVWSSNQQIGLSGSVAFDQHYQRLNYIGWVVEGVGRLLTDSATEDYQVSYIAILAQRYIQ